MSVNGMNVGRDYLIQFYDGSSGQLVDFGDVQNFKITEQKHDIANRPYNQPPKYGYIPDGYKVTFTITKTNQAIENYAVAAEAAFNSGQIIKAGFLNETITNTDGSISRYQYKGFVFFLTDHGDVSREKSVSLAAEGMASEKVLLA